MGPPMPEEKSMMRVPAKALMVQDYTREKGEGRREEVPVWAAFRGGDGVPRRETGVWGQLSREGWPHTTPVGDWTSAGEHGERALDQLRSCWSGPTPPSAVFVVATRGANRGTATVCPRSARRVGPGRLRGWRRFVVATAAPTGNCDSVPSIKASCWSSADSSSAAFVVATAGPTGTWRACPRSARRAGAGPTPHRRCSSWPPRR